MVEARLNKKPHHHRGGTKEALKMATINVRANGLNVTTIVEDDPKEILCKVFLPAMKAMGFDDETVIDACHDVWVMHSVDEMFKAIGK